MEEQESVCSDDVCAGSDDDMSESAVVTLSSDDEGDSAVPEDVVGQPEPQPSTSRFQFGTNAQRRPPDKKTDVKFWMTRSKVRNPKRKDHFLYCCNAVECIRDKKEPGSYYAIYSHVIYQHGTPNLKAVHLNQEYKTKAKKAAKDLASKKTFACSECSAAFVTSRSLSVHKTKLHNGNQNALHSAYQRGIANQRMGYGRTNSTKSSAVEKKALLLSKASKLPKVEESRRIYDYPLVVYFVLCVQGRNATAVELLAALKDPSTPLKWYVGRMRRRGSSELISRHHFEKYRNGNFKTELGKLIADPHWSCFVVKHIEFSGSGPDHNMKAASACEIFYQRFGFEQLSFRNDPEHLPSKKFEILNRQFEYTAAEKLGRKGKFLSFEPTFRIENGSEVGVASIQGASVLAGFINTFIFCPDQNECERENVVHNRDKVYGDWYSNLHIDFDFVKKLDPVATFDTESDAEA